MKINNKNFQDWTEEDLKVLLHNDAYRENNFIDYKVDFAPFKCEDKNKKKEKQAEFRSDVCSFANADGGYIFYGIGEDAGMAGALVGIVLSNPDRFELDRRNELQAIRPVMPEVEFTFVRLNNEKHVVILHIQRGLYKPYITEEPEGDFHFYIRHGNKKQAMSYTEMQNAFLNAAMLAEDIKSFRKARLNDYKEETAHPFALVHLIPATFKNQSDALSMYDLARNRKLIFESLFNGMVRDRPVPNVDGVYFPNFKYEEYDDEHLQIFNNGTVELRMNLYVYGTNKNDSHLKIERWLNTLEFWEELQKLLDDTAEMYKKLNRAVPMYVCVSIYGCKGLWNDEMDRFGMNAATKVDRNEIVCAPIEIRNILDDEQLARGKEDSVRMTKYALGIRK